MQLGKKSFQDKFTCFAMCDILRSWSNSRTDGSLACLCVSDSLGSPGTGSPAAVLCRRPRCCPPCASLHAAELKEQDISSHSIPHISKHLHDKNHSSYLCWGPAPPPLPPSYSLCHHLVYQSRYCCHWRPTGSRRLSPATHHSGPKQASAALWWGHLSAPQPGRQPVPTGGTAEGE